MKEEAGDLLASAIQLCNENDWLAEDLIRNTLNKIDRRKQQYKSLGRKTQVVLIAGALDPITEGHFKLAQFILNKSNIFDEAWFCPCLSHLYGKKMVDAEHRLAMCEIACKKDYRMKVFPYEIENKLGGETYHFVKRLLEEPFAKDQYNFSIAIGMDNANTFNRWVNYADLEKMITFVVVSRQGIDIDNKVDWYRKPPHIFINAEDSIPLVSSTEVKYNIQNNMSLDGLIDSDVHKYIIDHKLYGAK
jgi:nicotinate (nicotinamide) nucleotide adenylyltransferase